MTAVNLKNQLGKADIYVIDQFMKGRYKNSDIILDAGCGKGRNFIFLTNLGFTVFGCDKNQNNIETLQQSYPKSSLNVAELTDLSYTPNTFHHIICNAVLHFAENDNQFMKMLTELHTVLKPNGTLLIRMTSIFGLESKVIQKEGQHLLPDGTLRFLLNTDLIDKISQDFIFDEPLKTVNVNNLRCMSTLVLRKKEI